MVLLQKGEGLLKRLADSLDDDIAYSESMIIGCALSLGLLPGEDDSLVDMHRLKQFLRDCNVPRFWLLLSEQAPMKASLGFFWRYALTYPGEIHFYPDEVYRDVDPSWDEKVLLAQKVVFPFDQVAEKLGLDSEALLKSVEDLTNRGSNCWHLMGIRHFGGTWLVRMTLFSRYYKSHLLPS